MGIEPHWLEQRFKDLFPTRLGRPVANGTSPDHDALPADMDRYVAAAVRGVLSDLRNATEGSRNNHLNISAYRLGRFVGAGHLDQATADAWLEHVAREIGLDPDEIPGTIRSGLEAGRRDPFTLVSNDYRPSPATSGLDSVDHEHQAAVTELPPVELPKPLDWAMVLSDETPDIDWLIEGIIERGRLHALFAPSKSHKSLIVQYFCAELVQTAPDPVMYLDFENSRSDLKLRFGPRGMDKSAAELANLLYFEFPSLSALDTPVGGAQLEAMAVEYRPALVILDTTSRVIKGGENDSDTFRALYRCALARLKRLGIAVLRIDHAGKDVAQGQRGSSAKSDDVDTVWLLAKQTEDTFSLRCTHQRSGNHPELVTLHKRLGPLRFERLDDGANHQGGRLTIEQAAKELDKLDVGLDVGKNTLHALAKSHGLNTTARDIYEAQKLRREAAALAFDMPEMSGTRGRDTPFSQDQKQPGHGPGHSQSERPLSAGHTPGQHPGTPKSDVSRGVPEGAGTDRGGLVEAPLSRHADTVPPDRVPGTTCEGKEIEQAKEALVRAGIRFRVVR